MAKQEKKGAKRDIKKTRRRFRQEGRRHAKKLGPKDQRV